MLQLPFLFYFSPDFFSWWLMVHITVPPETPTHRNVVSPTLRWLNGPFLLQTGKKLQIAHARGSEPTAAEKVRARMDSGGGGRVRGSGAAQK